MKNKATYKIIISILVFFLLFGIGYVTYGLTPSGKLNKQLSLGNKYLTEHDYEMARYAFEEAIMLEPNNVEARIGYARAYMNFAMEENEERQYVNAMQAFDEISEMDEAEQLEEEYILFCLSYMEMYEEEEKYDECLAFIEEIKEVAEHEEISNKKQEVEELKEKQEEEEQRKREEEYDTNTLNEEDEENDLNDEKTGKEEQARTEQEAYDFFMGEWYSEGYDTMNNWIGSYQTTFSSDGTVIQAGWRNQDTGTYTLSSDYSHIIANYTENYINDPSVGGLRRMEDYEYTVVYELDVESGCLHAVYSEEAGYTNAEDGKLVRNP